MICLLLEMTCGRGCVAICHRSCRGHSSIMVRVCTIVMCWAISILKFSGSKMHKDILREVKSYMVLVFWLLLFYSVTYEQLTPISISTRHNNFFCLLFDFCFPLLLFLTFNFCIFYSLFLIFSSSCLRPLDVRDGGKAMFIEAVIWRRKCLTRLTFFFSLKGKSWLCDYVNTCMYTRVSVCVCVCVDLQWNVVLPGEKAYSIFNIEDSSPKWMFGRAGDWEPLLIVTIPGGCYWHWMGGGKECRISYTVWDTPIQSRIMPSQMTIEPHWGIRSEGFGDRLSRLPSLALWSWTGTLISLDFCFLICSMEGNKSTTSQCCCEDQIN